VDSAAVSVRGMGATVTRIGARNTPSVGVAVVGAGPAGLAASSRLARSGCSHVVLERERIAWSWRSQRWDSFRLNTPRWANRVPGEHLEGEPGSFASAPMLVAALERFAEGLPVVEGAEVQSARRTGRGWRLDTSYGALTAGAVVVASGFQNVPRRPAYADALPAELRQLHIVDYRRPDDLEDGVLVVGGGQSGVQIADELLEAGKRVYLSTSRVGRLPRRYLGRDAMEWMRESGQLDLPADQADPATLGATPPQVSGAGGGRTLSYQHLASRGATLLGRAVGWDGRRLELAPDLGENLRFADEASAFFRAAWERRAQVSGRTLGAAAQPDPADEPAPGLHHVRGPESLDLAAAGVSTVIWATGFGPSIGWLPSGALDARRRPQLPGLHVIGAQWLTHRSSANLYGMAADAERLAGSLANVCVRAAA
jgi:putative flavoprotein involved in K+ transport